MVKLFALLVPFLLCAEQVPWIKPTAEGLGLDQGKLDYTEGVGAYMDLHLAPLTLNFDNGGGSHDYNTIFLKERYGVENVVYDPFQRPEEHIDILPRVNARDS